MSKWEPSVLAVLTVLLCAPLVHGAIYKWQDEQGITHFSHAPPPASGSKSFRNRAYPQPIRRWKDG